MSLNPICHISRYRSSSITCLAMGKRNRSSKSKPKHLHVLDAMFDFDCSRSDDDDDVYAYRQHKFPQLALAQQQHQLQYMNLHAQQHRQQQHHTPQYNGPSLASASTTASLSIKVKKLTEALKPRNLNQETYIKMLESTLPHVVVAAGAAGTGKTSIAVSIAIQELNKNKYERIVISRPMVTVEEDLGFLPGGLADKMDPWMRPLYDTFNKYYSPDEVKLMIANKVIDICPIAYLRGRTLENSFIIVDEAQNCSVTQMLMILTRIGANSKMVITGDPMQHDRGRGVESGLVDLLSRLDASEHVGDIAQVKFDENDVERHPVIKSVLKLYKDHKKLPF
jgi:phosphate starvation-inducible protein PhoH